MTLLFSEKQRKEEQLEDKIVKFPTAYVDGKSNMYSMCNKLGFDQKDYLVYEDQLNLLSTTLYQYKSPKNVDDVLVLITGTHGLESQVGDGLVLNFLENHFQDFKDKMDISVIQSLNPWGYYFSSRVNEEGVDLNRNCFEVYENEQKNYQHYFRKYEEFYTEKFNDMWKAIYDDKPLLPITFEKIKFFYKIQKAIRSFGTENMKALLPKGQYQNSKAIFYGGNYPQQSILNLNEIIPLITDKRKTATIIDIHTGYGQINQTMSVTLDNKTDYAKAAVNEVFDTEILAIERENAYKATGTVLEFFQKKSLATETITLGLEYGTINAKSKLVANILSLGSLVIDKKIFNHPGKSPLNLSRYINPRSKHYQFVKDIFCPKDKKWQAEKVEHFNNTCSKILGFVTK